MRNILDLQYCHSPICCHNSIYGMTFKPFRALCLEGASCCCLDLYAAIYIYKTVVCDRVLTLYRPCAYPGAVLRHASGPTGPRNSSRPFSPFIKSSLPGSSKSRSSRKQTKPSLIYLSHHTSRQFCKARHFGRVAPAIFK